MRTPVPLDLEMRMWTQSILTQRIHDLDQLLRAAEPSVYFNYCEIVTSAFRSLRVTLPNLRFIPVQQMAGLMHR